MRVALYSEDKEELRQLEEYLEYCGRAEMRHISVMAFGEHMEFFRRIRDEAEPPDLLVIALDGTASLEIMDMVRARYPTIDIFWFSDLDFAVRSYYYGALWFGRKPVSLQDMRKAFRRKLMKSGSRQELPAAAAPGLSGESL